METKRKVEAKGSTALIRRPKGVREPVKIPRKRKVNPSKGILSPRTIKIIERRHDIMKLKRDGWGIMEIAKTMAMSSVTVQGIIRDCLNESLKDYALDVDQERQMQVDRLDALLRINMPAATTPQQRVILDKVTGEETVITEPPDPVYTAMVLKVEERRTKLLALDRPETKKLELTGIREYRGVNIDDV